MKKRQEKFDRWLVASAGLHVAVVLGIFVAPSLYQAKAPTWGSRGGSNGGVNIKIVSNMSGIALPSPVVASEDAVANDSKSLYNNPPEPKSKAPDKVDPEAVQLPSKTAPKKPAPAAPAKTASAATPQAPIPDNAVTYGRGAGNPSMRYGQTATGDGPTGADFGGDGTFGEKYGWYVDAMTNAISQAWVKGSANLTQQRAPRVYVTFTIARDGSVSDVQLQQASTQPVMDQAAVQAVKRAKLPTLPSDYRGSNVSVRFYFDYGK